MIYYASKTHNTLNGRRYDPETEVQTICVNPYYPVSVMEGTRLLIDSGAFQDVGEDTRLSFEDALKRQLALEERIGIQAEAIVSYDRLVDEQLEDGKQIKRRATEEEGEACVRETIEAAKYLASQREGLAPRKLILSCQGTTTEQYLRCIREVLQVARPGDIIGLGGFCIISKSKEAEAQFYEVIRKGFPLIASADIDRVHIFGVGIFRALIQAETVAKAHGITCSYDTSGYEVSAVFGKVLDPIKGQITQVYDKAQKSREYIPAELAKFNIGMVAEYWRRFDRMLEAIA